jgi:uncharacterized membrane protein YphA (DoxX/SURF4 family)
MKISFKTVVYWLCYAGYLYIIFPSAISKIIQRPQMMESMQSLGFNQAWTLAIGIAEALGVLIVLTGLFKPHFRTLGILVLFPFAVGAFTTQMAHQEYHHYYKSLAMCLLFCYLFCWLF